MNNQTVTQTASEHREKLLTRILQAPETNVVAISSKRSLDVTALHQVNLLLQQTKDNYPGQEPPEETWEMWIPQFVKLATRHGISGLRKALDLHMETSRFFPQPSEIGDILRGQMQTVTRVHVPLTRKQTERLVGRERAAQMSEDTVESVERMYGRESARRFKAQLDAEASTEAAKE